MLNTREAHRLAQLLDKMDWSPKNNVSLKVFLALNRNIIFVGVDLALIRMSGNFPEVLLTKRADNDPCFANLWHLTGAIVVPGATALSTIESRVAKPDFGMTLTGTPEFLMARDILKGPPDRDHSPRGQEIYRLYQHVLKEGEVQPSENEARKFFRLDEVPEAFIAHQLPSIEKLREVHGV